MSTELRILLIFVSLLSLIVVIRKIVTEKIDISYIVFWILFSFLEILLALFPQIAIYGAKVLGIESTVHFVYLVVIFLLGGYSFKITVRLSDIETRFKNLIEIMALEESDNYN